MAQVVEVAQRLDPDCSGLRAPCPLIEITLGFDQAIMELPEQGAPTSAS
jgi:hypothetical protein